MLAIIGTWSEGYNLFGKTLKFVLRISSEVGTLKIF